MTKNWRNSREYRIWKVTVVRRDGGCVICGSLKRRQAHHVNHATYFPKERFLPENGVTLCYKCHVNFHCNYLNSYRTKCTKKQFENFKQLIGYVKTVNWTIAPPL